MYKKINKEKKDKMWIVKYVFISLLFFIYSLNYFIFFEINFYSLFNFYLKKN